MGQYWLPVNLDKKEFVDPHKLGTGLKLWEQLANQHGTGSALIILTAAMPDRRGGGDLQEAEIIGRWAGDRIAIVGDYAEDTDLPEQFNAASIYDACQEGEYKDVSAEVCAVMERELDIKFTGTGWRDIEDAGKTKPVNQTVENSA